MAWESALDRLLLGQIHKAEKGEIPDRELQEQLRDYLVLARNSPKAWFHSGYARTLLGIELDEPSHAQDLACQRWYRLGRFRGYHRRGEQAWLRDLSENDAILGDMISDPEIVAQILPILMGIYFQDGKFEKAVQVLHLMEAQVPSRSAEADDCTSLQLLIEAGLSDMLARIERMSVCHEQAGSVRRALHSAMDLLCFEKLCAHERARALQALGESHLHTGDWEEAKSFLKAALDLCDDRGTSVRRRQRIHLLMALGELKLLDICQLEPQMEREGRDLALTLLQGSEPGDSTLPELVLARGILHYEMEDFAQATTVLASAVQLFEQEGDPDKALFAKARFYLGSSLLANGDRSDGHKAARLIEETVALVSPDLHSFYEVHDALKACDQRVALLFLDHVDVSRGTSPDNLLMVALEYQGLGEPERALEATKRVLGLVQDLDLRQEAMKVQLVAHNMQGKRDDARSDYLAIRDLLLQRGAFAELEKLLQEEDLVGLALDHLEIKCELADLYEEMEDRDWDRANLQLAMARSMRARKEVEDLKQAQALLKEIGLRYPELVEEDLESIAKLLDLRGEEELAQDDCPDSGLFTSLTETLGRKFRVMVVGGNERQRRHHPRLHELAVELGFDDEWLMANYASPQKTVRTIEKRIEQGLDILIMLHWNRHETTEPAHAIARSKQVASRTLFYAGFSSLDVCIRDMARQFQARHELTKQD